MTANIYFHSDTQCNGAFSRERFNRIFSSSSMEYFSFLSSSDQRIYIRQRFDTLSKSMQERQDRQLMRDILLTLQKLVEDEKKPNQYVIPSERCKKLSKHTKPRKAATIRFESRITQSLITVDISAKSTSMLSKLTDTVPRTNMLYSAKWHSFRSTSPRNNPIFDFLTLCSAFT